LQVTAFRLDDPGLVRKHRVVADDVGLTERVARFMLDADRAREAERRASFAPFGVASECLWPAARLYHEHSKIDVTWQPALTEKQIESLTLTLDYKRYPSAATLELPHPPPLEARLEAVVRARRSERAYSQKPIELPMLAKLLELGNGVVEVGKDGSPPRRAAPSGGGLYPIELYPLVLAVDGVSPGVYHYAPLPHVLEEVRRLDDIHPLRLAWPPGLHETNPSLIVAITAVFGRTQRKYLERGYRFTLLEAGHVAENLVLAATALGLESLCVGGFNDDALNRVLGIEDDTVEAAVYAVFIGNPLSRSKGD
jgi:SagB-type dehydrogenase family enzyme